MLATKTEIKSNNVYFMVLLTPCSFCTYTCIHTLHLSLWNHFHCHTLSHPPHTQHMHTAEYILRGWRLMEGATMLSLSSHISAIEAPVHTMLFITMQLQNNGAELAPISIPHQGNKVSTPPWPPMPTRNMSIPFLLFSFFCSIYLSCQIIMTSCLIHINVGLLLAFSPETSLPAESYTGHISSLWSFVGVLSFWYLKKMFPIFLIFFCVCTFCIA